MKSEQIRRSDDVGLATVLFSPALTSSENSLEESRTVTCLGKGEYQPGPYGQVTVRIDWLSILWCS